MLVVTTAKQCIFWLSYACALFAFAISCFSSSIQTSLPVPVPRQQIIAPYAMIDHAITNLYLFLYEPPTEIARALELHIRPSRMEMALESDLFPWIQSFYSSHVVDDPLLADFYFVPHALIAHSVGCYHTPTSVALSTCSFSKNVTSGSIYWKEALEPFLKYIVYDLPFFNASQGTNHIIYYAGGNGPICDDNLLSDTTYLSNHFFKSTVHRMIIVGSHGTLKMRIPVGADSTWATTRMSRFRSECFRPGHDISMPQYRSSFLAHDGERELEQCIQKRKCEHWLSFLAQTAAAKTHAFYFTGTYSSQQLISWCSPGIRDFVRSFCTKSNSCTSLRLAGVFALAPAGAACWSMRFYDSLSNLAIPIIMADLIVEPFEQFLDYSVFCAKIETHPLTGMSGKEKQNEEQQKLHELEMLSLRFRRACTTLSASCLSHPLSQKLAAIVQVRPWLTSPRGFVKFFLLELACRSTVHAAKTDLCDLKASARVASRGSFW